MLLAQELGCNTLLGMAIVVMGAYLGSQSTKGTCLSECYSSVMAQEIGPSYKGVRASRLESADFVVTRRRKTASAPYLLTPAVRD